MGDSEKRWNNKPFQITASGIFIVPPKMVSQDRYSIFMMMMMMNVLMIKIISIFNFYDYEF
jgi:hypothetical protein